MRSVKAWLGVVMAVWLAVAVAAQPVPPAPPTARVRIVTTLGPIVIEVDGRHAPITAANFLHYVDARRFDGTTFYRAARNKYVKTYGLVQGGIDHVATRSFMSIAHEPTSKTGLRHIDGTVSMARSAPGTAMGDFFITLGTSSYLDARGDYPGYAAFGKVVSGMDVVRKILALKTYPGGWPEMKDQTISDQPRILAARRIP